MLLFPGKRKRTIKKQTLISPWPFFSHPEDAATILLYPVTGENQTFSPAFLCVLKNFLSSLQPGLPCIPAVYKLYHWAALSAAFFYCFATQSPPSEFSFSLSVNQPSPCGGLNSSNNCAVCSSVINTLIYCPWIAP